MSLLIWVIIVAAAIIFVSGIRIIRPTHRGIVETFGKYTSFRQPGFNWVFPIIQKLGQVNITEKMSHIDPQEIITGDKLNAVVDLVVYFKIKKDEQSVKNSIYEVDDVQDMLETLARTTARNVIGTMPFNEVNSERKTLNEKLQAILVKETKDWGVEVLKVELKDINPPKSVQDSMNLIIVAENKKVAAINLATSVETEADGQKRAKIKSAEGFKQAKILEADGDKQAIVLRAEGQARAFTLQHTNFVGNAQLLRKLEVTENSLKDNAKIILSKDGINPQIILGDIPIKERKSRS